MSGILKLLRNYKDANHCNHYKYTTLNQVPTWRVGIASNFLNLFRFYLLPDNSHCRKWTGVIHLLRRIFTSAKHKFESSSPIWSLQTYKLKLLSIFCCFFNFTKNVKRPKDPNLLECDRVFTRVSQHQQKWNHRHKFQVFHVSLSYLTVIFWQTLFVSRFWRCQWWGNVTNWHSFH